VMVPASFGWLATRTSWPAVRSAHANGTME
jgi:hypothetical protein